MILTDRKNGRSPNAPPFDQKCTEWNKVQEECARHGAYKLHKSSSRRKDTTRWSTKQTSSEVMFIQRRSIPRRIYIVGSGASLHSIPPETKANDFVFFIIQQIRIRFFVVAKIFFRTIRLFGVFKVQSHAMRLYMCMCCGLCAPTQFQFECCCVLDDSRLPKWIFI